MLLSCSVKWRRLHILVYELIEVLNVNECLKICTSEYSSRWNLVFYSNIFYGVLPLDNTHIFITWITYNGMETANEIIVYKSIFREKYLICFA